MKKALLLLYTLVLYGISLANFTHPIQKYLYFGPQKNTYVTTIAEDSIGRIWLGTESGIVYFDGQKYFHPENFHYIETENLSKIITLNKDSLLVIGRDQIFLIDNLQQLPTIHPPLDWSINKFYYDGVIFKNWICIPILTDSSLMLLDRNLQPVREIHLEGRPIALSGWKDFLVIGDNLGKLFVFKYENNELNYLHTIQITNEAEVGVYSLLLKEEYAIASLVGIGVFFIDNYQSPEPKVSFLSGTERKTLLDIKEDPLESDTFWAGSQYSGLFQFNRESILQNVTISRYLSSSLVQSLHFDKQNRLFIGTQYGLNIIQNVNIKSIFSFSGLPNDFIWSIHPVNNEIWVGTSKGLAVFKQDGQSYKMIDKPFLKKLREYSIFKIMTVDNTVYLITSGYPGLMRLENNKLVTIDNLPVGKDVSILDIDIDRNKNIWLCGDKVIKYHHPTQKSSVIPLPDFKGRRIDIFSVLALPNGRVFIGTAYGVVESDGVTSWFIGNSDSLRLNVNTMTYDPEKELLFISTTGKGLYEYDLESNHLSYSGLNKKIAGTDIFFMKKVTRSLFIFGTELGLTLYNEHDGSWQYLNSANGLSNNEINTQSVYLDKDILWVGTGNGLNIVNMKQFKAGIIKPKIYISSIRPFDIKDPLTLPFRNNFLEIHFGNLLFSPDQLFKSYYKISGLDTSWFPLSSPVIYLRNIAPGSYKIQAQTFWRDSVFASDILEFPFVVERPFWYSFTGIILGLLLLTSLVLIVIKFRTKRLEKLAARLKKELEVEQIRSIEYESIFTEIFKHSSMGILFVNKNGSIISANDSALAFLATIEVGDIKNITDTSIFKQSKILKDAWNDVHKNGFDHHTVDIEITKPIHKHLRFYFWKLYSKREERIGILISDLSGIIKERSMEVQLTAYNQILATLSHYLNNTMAILSLAEENYHFDPENRHQKLSQISRHSVKKVKYILDLLENTVNSEKLKFRDYIDAKNLLIDLEEEIKRFNEENKLEL